MAGKLDGQVAIVTAGGSGIGAASAVRFAQEGAAVIVADLSGKRAEAVTAQINDAGGKATMIKMDVADPDGIQATIQLALDTYGRLDVMFNNAGLGELSRLEDMSLESWNRTIAVTLTGTFLGMKYCLPIMRQQAKGAIVNTASVSGIGGDYGMSAYNAAKAGVINLTRVVAVEYARNGIRANCVCPGAINTPLIAPALEIAGFQDKFDAAIPVGRLGEPEEIANVVLFLASDLASFVTGSAFVADGGQTAKTGSPSFLAEG
jgi:meso-butanediol dehydrogenase/(S,S)-butanediol dehydrogenase/diacetyl reductase